MLFNYFYTKQEVATIRKDEYLRGAEATAAAFREREETLASQTKQLQDNVVAQQEQLVIEWNSVNKAKKELENFRASIILDGIKEIINGENNTKVLMSPVGPVTLIKKDRN